MAAGEFLRSAGFTGTSLTSQVNQSVRRAKTADGTGQSGRGQGCAEIQDPQSALVLVACDIRTKTTLRINKSYVGWICM